MINIPRGRVDPAELYDGTTRWRYVVHQLEELLVSLAHAEMRSHRLFDSRARLDRVEVDKLRIRWTEVGVYIDWLEEHAEPGRGPTNA